MRDLFAELLDKKLLMVTGKGGIGKTLTSYALAQLACAQGKKVCLVESSAHDQLAPLFGSEPVGHNLRELQPRLHVINLNAQDNFRDFVIKHLGFAKLFEKVFTRPIVRSFIQMMPGIAELTLLGRLFYFSELDREDRFDLVILDGFASGHFQSLMKTPDAVLQSGMLGPVIEETRRVQAFVTNPLKTAVVLVAVAEELVISEALEFSSRLRLETKAPLTTVLVNRLFPKLPSDLDNSRYPSNIQVGIDYWQKRRAGEQRAIDRLREGLATQSSSSGQALSLYALEESGAFNEPLVAAELVRWLEAAIKL
ncbi:MAG: hypothetical protein NTX25_07010 [Proteobacteria bacterium]|nr:hypothetical protein [Pseudomonadota bacterium]